VGGCARPLGAVSEPYPRAIVSDLSRDPNHGREPAPENVPWTYRCKRCHKPYRQDGRGGFKPPSGYCPGMKVGAPKSSGRPKSVSDRKDKKRSSSLTGERLEFGKVCDWIRDQPCALADHLDHKCRFYGDRTTIEPAHLSARGLGYGDWVLLDGKIVLNVLPLCPRAHDELDGQLVGHGGRSQFEREYAVDPRFLVRQLQKSCPVNPPEHYQLKA